MWVISNEKLTIRLSKIQWLLFHYWYNTIHTYDKNRKLFSWLPSIIDQYASTSEWKCSIRSVYSTRFNPWNIDMSTATGNYVYSSDLWKLQTDSSTMSRENRWVSHYKKCIYVSNFFIPTSTMLLASMRDVTSTNQFVSIFFQGRTNASSKSNKNTLYVRCIIHRTIYS